MPRQFVARLIEREEVAPASAIVRLTAPRAVLDAATPGQFVMLGLAEPGGRDPLLPRPYGIMRATKVAAGMGDEDEGALELLVFTGARGAARLASGRPGEPFAALGPLGAGFALGARVQRALLLGVGHGVAPLVGLAEAALARGVAVTMLLGAPTAAQFLPLAHLPDEAEIAVATADGTRGHHGAATDLLPQYLAWADAIYAYAPESNYAELREALRRHYGARRPPPAQVAVERGMACGVGVCLGCVVATRAGLRTVCRDGPVFALDDLVLE